MIIDHTTPMYVYSRAGLGSNRHNGAYYYSKEICERIIPNVRTDRSWITVNVPGHACDHAIVFIHNNLHTDHYDWLRKYKDLVLVCGVPETCGKVEHIGRAIYLPLSIDVEEVRKYACKKTKKRAFCGRPSKRMDVKFPPGTDFIENRERSVFLAEMAKYEEVYAVGRAALEAKALGCRVLPYDPRFPDPSVWVVMDSLEAAAILQHKLDEIDNKG